MRHDEPYKALHESPFQPFRMQLSNGDSWVIQHPDFAGLTRTSVLVFISSHDDNIPDTFNQYNLLHVVGLELTHGAKANGRRPRKKRR